MTKEETAEIPNIILNSLRCNNCETVIISHSRHDFVTCKCGDVHCDGGTDYLKRGYRSGASFTDLSVYSNAPFEVIRESLYRGGRGKDGTEPLKWVVLKEMSDDWIKNTIQYNIDWNMGNGNEYYIKELNYRIEKNIVIKDT